MPPSLYMFGLKPSTCRCISAPLQRQRALRSVKCFSEASTDEPTPKRKQSIKSTIGSLDSLLGIEEEEKVPFSYTPALRNRVGYVYQHLYSLLPGIPNGTTTHTPSRTGCACSMMLSECDARQGRGPAQRTRNRTLGGSLHGLESWDDCTPKWKFVHG